MVDPIIIPEETRYPEPSHSKDCIYPLEYEGHFSTLMIKREEIHQRSSDLAKAIAQDYKGRRPVLLCILKGASPFYHLLSEALQDLKQGYYMEFMNVSSYEGTSSTGNVKVDGGDSKFKNLMGKDLLIVEDIIDTGTTLSHLVPFLKEKCQPKSIEICSLLVKRLDEPPKADAKYIGFSIPNHFIVGFGLDYNELYRDVKDIWIISQKGIDFDQSTFS